MQQGVLSFIQKAAGGVHRRARTLDIRQTLARRGLSHAHQIPTHTVREELEALYLLGRECAPNSRVLEVGSYLGASTCYLAAGLLGATASIVCIDTWHNETMPEGNRDTFAQFEKNVGPIRHLLTLIRKYSNQVTPPELGSQFELVFLDGDHSYDQTRSDFTLFSPLVAQNGVLAFHDSLFFEGVSRVVGEALASAKWQIGGNVRNLFWIRRAQFTHKS